jgi:hypothetical protein
VRRGQVLWARAKAELYSPTMTKDQFDFINRTLEVLLEARGDQKPICTFSIDGGTVQAAPSKADMEFVAGDEEERNRWVSGISAVLRMHSKSAQQRLQRTQLTVCPPPDPRPLCRRAGADASVSICRSCAAPARRADPPEPRPRSSSRSAHRPSPTPHPPRRAGRGPGSGPAAWPSSQPESRLRRPSRLRPSTLDRRVATGARPRRPGRALVTRDGPGRPGGRRHGGGS